MGQRPESPYLFSFTLLASKLDLGVEFIMSAYIWVENFSPTTSFLRPLCSKCSISILNSCYYFENGLFLLIMNWKLNS
jgi:hypothetical protein